MNKMLSEGHYFGAETKQYEDNLFKLNITKYEPGLAIERHYHENDYLSILLKGSYQEVTRNEEQLVKSGNTIFRPADYIHQNRFHINGGACFNIEFKNNWHQTLDIKNQLPLSANIYATGSYPSLYRLFQHFINCEPQDLLNSLIIDWILEVSSPVTIKPSSLQWVDKVKNIIINEPEVSHTLKSISERVYVHPVYLAAAFKKRTGFTIGEYILKSNLQKSVTALFTTSLPINEIAVSTGFFDAAHFIRSFKTHYHIAPSRFREALNCRAEN